ncbi:hypothetical protein SDC9_208603 [bioreactor metagenome]|uniref:Uncharacterized protein n=1 Tax=bioreactor metagenome TaxID=1076179 RepID=A0A645JCS5_9ZZZZ
MTDESHLRAAGDKGLDVFAVPVLRWQFLDQVQKLGNFIEVALRQTCNFVGYSPIWAVLRDERDCSVCDQFIQEALE